MGIATGKVTMLWDRVVCAGLPGRPGPRAAVPPAAAGPGRAAEEPGRRLLRSRPPIRSPGARPPPGHAGARPAPAPGDTAGKTRNAERVSLGPDRLCCCVSGFMLS